MAEIQTVDCGMKQLIRQLDGHPIFVYTSGPVASIGAHTKFFSNLGDAILVALEDYRFAKAQCKRASGHQDMVIRALVDLENAWAVYQSESGHARHRNSRVNRAY
tara:strand:+ start:282 stop:596 length:315 start_codon:yes stop_codon:yes gene_type:complete